MVLQRNIPLEIWGWAEKGEKVHVEFNGLVLNTTADKNGNWEVKLPPLKEGGPFTMTIIGKNITTLENILVGDVWVCSGQSNMEFKLREAFHGEYEIENSRFPMIRMLEVKNKSTYSLQDDIETEGWKECKPESTRSFSAVAYFFARDLCRKYKIPIGLIEADWGGSPVETWMDVETLKTFPQVRLDLEKYKLASGEHNLPSRDLDEEKALWLKRVEALDKIARNGVSYSAQSCNCEGWKTMQLPGIWETKGLPDYDGIIWFRKEITLTKEQAGKDLELHFGGIDDSDCTWFNGEEIGNTDNFKTQRRYHVPGRLVKEGKNTIAVRVIDNEYGGGFSCSPNDFKMLFLNSELSLAGEWEYKPTLCIEQLPPLPVMFRPGTFYNGMVYPLQRFGIKGVIWYQGESNTHNVEIYSDLFASLITTWRKQWNEGDFPFLFVQLAGWKWGTKWPLIREGQDKALALPATGMATAIDIGDSLDIHPKNKQEVGHRLALEAMKVAYNEKEISFGPKYRSFTKEGNKIRVKFNELCPELIVLRGEPLNNFIIAGDDRQFYPASAVIEGNTILVWSEKVRNPVAVRYAWQGYAPSINLYGSNGLPAYPFRTDKW
jgi:sialate O-acetylesterase